MSLKTNTFVIASLLLFVGLATSARADCDTFSRRVQQFQSEAKRLNKEYERVNAMNPKLKLNNSSHFIALGDYDLDCISDKTRFTDGNKTRFMDGMEKMGSGAATLVGVYCSNDELQQPIKSEIFE
jgi:hypothetical protein